MSFASTSRNALILKVRAQHPQLDVKKKRMKLNCTLKVRQKKSNFWGVFIIKLTYEDKVQIYEPIKPEYVK